MDGDIDRDGEMDKDRDKDGKGDTERDKDLSSGYLTLGNNF
jgi:hypothetical protein